MSAKSENLRDQVALSGDDTGTASGRRGKRKLLLLLTLVGGLAVAAKKLLGGGSSTPSYSPPAYVPPTPDVEPAHPGQHLAEDAAGATPDEAVADSTDEPHPVTTPDEPAATTDITEQPSA